MNPAVTNVMNMPFVQVALPILIGFITIGWWQNRRLDEMSRRFDDRIDALNRRMDEMNRSINARLDEICKRLDRIARLEERTALVRS